MDPTLFFNKIPKTELHLHLDGAFTLEFLYELVKKYKPIPTIHSIDEIKKKFGYKDFSHFIETWFWKNNLYREPIDFEESVFQSLNQLSNQNIIYIEAFISPWDYHKSGLKTQEIVSACVNGIYRAEKACNIKCRLIIDITRDHGHETAIDRLNEISKFLGKTVIGIGLGGSEQKYPAYLFKKVFLEAKRRGFHCVAHAGEVSGPESIWSAIKDLEVERIGHGVRAVEDQKLLSYLATNKIPLEVCINSNIKTRVYSKYINHPLSLLIENGILVTLNSDDPTMFESTLANEYILALNEIEIPLEQINRMLNNNIDASFASTVEKNSYKKLLNSYWITNVHKID
jgi:adenosine deaminase